MIDLKNEIKIKSILFRKAVEKCEPHRLPVSLKEFPNGSCGDASILLGRYLHEEGLGNFDYVSGTMDDGVIFKTHAWLKQNTLIIDITANQFDEFNEKVFVSTNTKWHNKFKQEIRKVDDYREYAKESILDLNSAYKLILNRITND